MDKLITIKLRQEFSLIDSLTERIDKTKFKIIGSYLYRNDFHDIDIVTADIETGYQLKLAAIKNKIKIQIVFVSENEFINIENLLTFNNISFSWYNGEYIFGENFTDSKTLSFNNKSLIKFKNSKVIFAEIEKMKKRGFKYEDRN